MNVKSIVAYVATLIVVYFSLSGLIQSLVGGLMSRAVGLLLGMLIGAIFAWGFIDLLWVFIEGGHIPLVLLIVAIAFIVLHSIISKKELTQASKWMMTAELWAIILYGVFLLLQPDSVRWY